MRKNHSIVEIEVIYVHQTERGLLVKRDEKEKDGVWLPLSQIEVDSPIQEKGRVITIQGPEWLFIEKELI